MHPAIIIICGPTASGKSHLSQQIGAALGATIINADSMQIYKELRILSARPSEEEEALLPHRLYGHVSLGEHYSAGRWISEVSDEIRNSIAAGRPPVLVGGTGLYIKALMEGMADIPSVAPEIRDAVGIQHQELGAEAFHARLMQVDAEIAARLTPGDSQRMKRAMEVWQETGKPLSYWQKMPKIAPFPTARFMLLMPDIPRELLYQRCDERLDAMLVEGVMAEVNAIDKKEFSPEMTGMKAVGLPEFLAYARKEMTLEEALKKAKQMTRNYAKRQLTWFRNQLPSVQPVPADFATNKTYLADLQEKLANFVDHAQVNH